MLLTVATAGIPSTLSKMVSERHALNKPAEARRVYHLCAYFAGAAGVVMTPLCFIQPHIMLPILLSDRRPPRPSRHLPQQLLLFPAIAMMRGYFQGRNNMTAGGISQIIEQIARVLTAIGLAYVCCGWVTMIPGLRPAPPSGAYSAVSEHLPSCCTLR